MNRLNCRKEDANALFEQLTSATYFKLAPREYWIMTEVFVYLHGTDECKDPACPHCTFISAVFGLERDSENPEIKIKKGEKNE